MFRGGFVHSVALARLLCFDAGLGGGELQMIRHHGKVRKKTKQTNINFISAQTLQPMHGL